MPGVSKTEFGLQVENLMLREEISRLKRGIPPVMTQVGKTAPVPVVDMVDMEKKLQRALADIKKLTFTRRKLRERIQELERIAGITEYSVEWLKKDTTHSQVLPHATVAGWTIESPVHENRIIDPELRNIPVGTELTEEERNFRIGDVVRSTRVRGHLPVGTEFTVVGRWRDFDRAGVWAGVWGENAHADERFAFELSEIELVVAIAPRLLRLGDTVRILRGDTRGDIAARIEAGTEGQVVGFWGNGIGVRVGVLDTGVFAFGFSEVEFVRSAAHLNEIDESRYVYARITGVD